MPFCAADAVRDHFLNSARRGFDAIGLGSHGALDARHPHGWVFAKELLPGRRQAQIGAALKAGVAMPRAGYMKFGLFGPDGDQDSLFGLLLHAAGLSHKDSVGSPHAAAFYTRCTF
jgi:hypothetical protein